MGLDRRCVMCISLQVQDVISCIVCIVASSIIWWCRLWLYPQQHVEEDFGCNDPNCLRCHSSTSIQMQNFRTNVMLLHRLIKLEPQLFVGMRSEILTVAEEMMMMQQGQKKHIGHQRWLNKIQQLLWSIISALSLNNLMLALQGGKRSNGSSIDMMTIMTTKSTTMLSLRQPGQNPTVFYLPGLDSTPVHHADNDDGNACCSRVNCPCSRLWKKFEENTDNTDRSRSSKLPVGKIKIYPRMGGDIEALTNGYDSIKRELLEYLRLHSSCDTRNSNSSSPFQQFDSKVYTHASGSTSHNRSSQNNSVSNDYSNHHHQQEEDDKEQQPEWSSIYLYHRGVIQSDLCQTYFPLTTNLLQTQCTHSMAGSCGLGSVYFSKLGSNTKIKEHWGPTNVRWRCHLPLIVPSSPLVDDSNSSTPNVGVDDSRQRRRRQSCLRVGQVGVNEEYVYWKEGKPILFDDSFLHSAVHYHDVNDDDTTDAAYGENACASSSKSSSNNNNSSSINNIMNGARIVLIVDLWHPSLTQSDRTAFGVLYPPGS